MTVFSEFAPAKINLYLHVTGRRPDGYHELDSLVVFTDAGDRLEARVGGDEDRLTLSGPFAAGLSPNADNLILKAARLYRDKRPHMPPVLFHLEKNLPLASGIGGGSSDAAAALRLMRRLDADPPPDEILRDLALALGADVPVCLDARPAVMRGIGEILSAPPPLPDFHLLLVNPGQALPTADVFRAYARAPRFSAPHSLRPCGSVRDLAHHLKTTHNDLEGPARYLLPILDTVLSALAAQPGAMLVRMSGSGATCFGMFANRFQAERAARLLSEQHPDWWVCPTSLWRRGTGNPLPSGESGAI